MSSPIVVSRGAEVLRRVLREQTFDLREVDVGDFRDWLNHHLVHWRSDPVFIQSVRIRDLRRSCPSLEVLEREHRRLRAADAASPSFARLERLEGELTGARRAIEGLRGALQRADPQRRPELQRKLSAFRAKRQALEQERAELMQSSPERQALLRIEDELRRLRAAIGLDQEEEQLAQLSKERGRRGGRAGQAFERTAATVSEREIAPDLRSSDGGQDAASVRVLHGVTLGAARLEFDQLIVQVPSDPAEAVDVLAAVETKRNLNDLAHGFRRRQENLAWLTGDAAAYEPQAHRTKRFPSGHFDRPATHEHKGQTFVFTRRSFQRFRRDPETGLFLDRLYFITRRGPVWGLSSAALKRIAHRVATDEQGALDDEARLRALWRWSRSLARSIETHDVLRWYASAAPRGRQILLIGGGLALGGGSTKLAKTATS